MEHKAPRATIIQLAEYLPSGLHAELKRAGFQTEILLELEDCIATREDWSNTILFIFTGHSESSLIQSAKAILQNFALKRVPVIFLGKDAEGLDALLGKSLEWHYALGIPFHNEDVLRAFQLALKFLEADKLSVARAQTKQPSEKKETEFLEVPQAFPEPDFIHPLYQSNMPISDMLLHQVFQLGLSADALRGDQLILPPHALDYLKDAYLQSQQNTFETISTFMDSLSEKLKEHIGRTSFIADRIGSGLHTSSEDAGNIRAAAHLFAQVLLEHAPDLYRGNYLDYPHEKREELSKKIAESAMRTRDTLKNVAVANIIQGMADLLMSRAAHLDERVYMQSSNLMAADIIDRMCFRAGHWDPKGSNALMRKARSGDLRIIHPLVLACAVKFVCEAVTYLPKIFVLRQVEQQEAKTMNDVLSFDTPSANRQNAQAINVDPPAHEEEQSVSITALQPGMRLSRSIKTHDGKELLRQGVLLDRDLIWRIWQLSSIRVLQTPRVERA